MKPGTFNREENFAKTLFLPLGCICGSGSDGLAWPEAWYGLPYPEFQISITNDA